MSQNRDQLTSSQERQVRAHFERLGRFPFICDVCGNDNWQTRLVALLVVGHETARHHVELTCTTCEQVKLFHIE